MRGYLAKSGVDGHQPINRTEAEREDESILKINVVKQLVKVSTIMARQVERVRSGIAMMLWHCKARGSATCRENEPIENDETYRDEASCLLQCYISIL